MAELSELKKSGPDKKAEEGLRKELEEANKMLEEAVEHSEELTVEIEGERSCCVLHCCVLRCYVLTNE